MAKTQAAEPLRKITVKTVYGEVDLERLLKDKTKALPIMDVYGLCRKSKAGETDFGPYVRFLGEFRAVNCETGAMYRAPVLLLPKFLEEELAAATGDANAAKEVEFAFRLSAKYDAKAATKYVYLADSLVEASQSDAMTALESRIAEQRKLLSDKSKK